MLVGGGTWCGGAVARAVTVSVLRVTWCLKLLHVRRRNCRLGTYNCDMGSIHLGAIALLSESEGVFTTAQAERMGVPRDALHDAVESGRLERIIRGAYRMIGSGTSYTDGLKLTAPASSPMSPQKWGIGQIVHTAALKRGNAPRPRGSRAPGRRSPTRRDDHEDDRQGHGHRVRRVRRGRGAPGDRGYDHRPRRVAREALVRGGCAGYPSNAA